MIEEPIAILRYYGISPWEIEVLYSYLNSRFRIKQEELEPDFENVVSFMEVILPVSFGEEFFQWFDFRRWEKVKALFKEMKRRRGNGNALKIQINFQGTPNIKFILDVEDKQWHDNAIEKIDFVLELLPFHLDPQKLPSQASEISYVFDTKSIRWRLKFAVANGKRFMHEGNTWNPI